MSIENRGDNPQNTHHCDGCGCPEEPDVPTIEQAQELLKSTIPEMLEEMRQEIGPYRVLFPWICDAGYKYMRFVYESEEDSDLRMGLRLLLTSDNGKTGMRMEWDVFGYSIYHTKGCGWYSDLRHNHKRLEQDALINELAHAPAMREAIALLREWLKGMRRSVLSDITERTRALLAPDTPIGETSDAQDIADKLVEVARAYELNRDRGKRLEEIVQRAIEGIEISKSYVKSIILQELREDLESALAQEKKYDSKRYVHI